MLHQIEVGQLEDWLNGMTKWGIVTRNDVLTSISALYRYGQARRWVPSDFNPAKGIKRRKHLGNTIAIFDPREAEQIFARLSVRATELLPLFALWCFAGIRKDEIARMTWPQVNQGLASGHIELMAGSSCAGHGEPAGVADPLPPRKRHCRAKVLAHVDPEPGKPNERDHAIHLSKDKNQMEGKWAATQLRNVSLQTEKRPW